ncbi:ComEC/Rec2 family competence protein [Caldisericum exile]|uniref:ComEC/Rec2 family competence protein n=1 Tax=Caldisericum exile TaxID=693075 RepID=UPI003C721B4B
MLSFLVLLTTLLGLGISITFEIKNYFIAFVLILSFFLVLIISKKNFRLGLIFIFLLTIINGAFTFKKVFNTINYVPVANTNVEISGSVKDFYEISGENYIYYLNVSSINGHRSDIVIKVYSKEIPPPKNSIIQINGKITKSDTKLIYYQNTLTFYPNKIKIFRKSKFYTFLTNLRTKVINNIRTTLKSEQGNLLISTLVGINTLENETKESFELTGTAHIFAISGLHIGVIYLFFMSIFKLLNPFAPIISILFTFLFIVFIGLKFSAIRAFLMLTIMALGNYLGRGKNLLNSLLVAMAFILAVFPESIISISFYLSCLAILGIITALNFDFKQKILNLLNTSFFVNLYEAPLVLFFFNTIPIISIPLNLFVIPYISFLLPIGLMYTLVSLASLKVASILSPFINALYGFLIFVVDVTSKLRVSSIFGTLNSKQFFFLESFILFATFLFFSKAHARKKGLVVLTLLFLLIFFVTLNAHTTDFIIENFQNSQLILLKNQGRNLLIIKNSETYSPNTLYSFVKRSGINYIDAIFLIKNPTVKEGAQINELQEKKILIKKFYANQSVNKDYLILNFQNCEILPQDFNLVTGNVSVVLKNQELKIFLAGKSIYP